MWGPQCTCVGMSFALPPATLSKTPPCYTPTYAASTWVYVWPVPIAPTSCIGTVMVGIVTWRHTTKSVPHYGHALADEACEAQKVLFSQGAEPQALEIPESQHPTTKEVSPDDLENSSSDSDSSDMSTQEEEEPSASQRDPYTSQQKKYVKEGAYALKGQPTLESLMCYPHAWKQPTTNVVAM